MTVLFDEATLADADCAQSLSPASVQPSLPGVVVGLVVGWVGETRTPLVVYPGQPLPNAIPARSAVDLAESLPGSKVALMFEQCDPLQPLIMGWIRPAEPISVSGRSPVEVEADGTRLVVAAEEELVLRCGKASITLTKVGKVLISGTYVSSHSSGVHRVRGASVQIN